MSEDAFAERLVALLVPYVEPHKIARKKSLLYDLSFDHRGVVAMGVDPDSGEPIRGGGRGFEQDILVFDEVCDSHTSIVPRIVAELKVGRVTTHDVIVYSEKADRIRRVYPYLRYGLVLGNMLHIPGRVVRLGQRFDFIAVLGSGPGGPDLAKFGQLMRDEAAASVTLARLLFEKGKPTLIHRRLISETRRGA